MSLNASEAPDGAGPWMGFPIRDILFKSLFINCSHVVVS